MNQIYRNFLKVIQISVWYPKIARLILKNITSKYLPNTFILKHHLNLNTHR